MAACRSHILSTIAMRAQAANREFIANYPCGRISELARPNGVRANAVTPGVTLSTSSDHGKVG